MDERRTVILDANIVAASAEHPDVENVSLAFGRHNQGIMIEFRETAGLPVQPIEGVRYVMISIAPQGLRFRWTDIHGRECIRQWNPEQQAVAAIEQVLADPVRAAFHAVMSVGVRDRDLFHDFTGRS